MHDGQVVNQVYNTKCFEYPPLKCATKETRLVKEFLMDPSAGQLAHNSLSLKRYLAKNNISVTEHHCATSFSSQKSCPRTKELSLSL